MGTLERTVRDINNVKIQGARSIAISGLKALREVASKHGFGSEFKRACNLLEISRPTAVALHNTIEDVRKNMSLEEIDKMIYYFDNVASVIASQNYRIVKNNSTVLTHCHSSVVVELLTKAWEKGLKFRVVATETRPLLQGKQTAKELSENGIPVVYCIDMAPGHLLQMHKNKINMVLLGADSMRKEGVVNKLGSYMISIFAKENRIPVYFAGELLKIDKRKKSFIEERHTGEIINRGELPKVRIENPAFDLTPWKYVTGIATERGLMNPRQIMRMFR